MSGNVSQKGRFFLTHFRSAAGAMSQKESSPLTHKYTLEDLCFFKGKELIVGTISHEFILQVYPPNGAFEQAILPLGAWERLGYPAPALLT